MRIVPRLRAHDRVDCRTEHVLADHRACHDHRGNVSHAPSGLVTTLFPSRAPTRGHLRSHSGRKQRRWRW
eukprot:1719317-Pleurochrysis_carterae.AAC.1